MNLIREILTGSLLLIAGGADSMEIKPTCLGIGQGGAECSKANTKIIKYSDPSDECKTVSSYALSNSNQPIHEAITRIAYEKVFKKPLGNFNYLQPLLSGVEWNDDPEQLIKKLFYDNGFLSNVTFARRFQLKPPNKMTVRSHFGDMQFLHAMRPTGMEIEKATPDDVKGVIYEWIKNTYAVAIGDIKYNESIKDTYFVKYFDDESGYTKIANIFDPRGMYAGAKYGLAIQRLASGSILHIIQDSYSGSHTERNSTDWQLVDFQHYPNDNHCLSDTGSTENRNNIEQAISASAEYMSLKDKSADWCAEMSPFIQKIFGMKSYVDDTCKTTIKRGSTSPET